MVSTGLLVLIAPSQEHRGAFGPVVAEDAGDAPAGQTQEEEDSKDAGTTAVEDDVGTDESGAGADTTDDDEPHVRWSTTEVSTRGRCDVRAEVGPAANSSYPLMATHARSFLFYGIVHKCRERHTHATHTHTLLVEVICSLVVHCVEEPEVESITPDKGSATGGDEITVMGLRLIDTKQATYAMWAARRNPAQLTPRVCKQSEADVCRKSQGQRGECSTWIQALSTLLTCTLHTIDCSKGGDARGPRNLGCSL